MKGVAYSPLLLLSWLLLMGCYNDTTTKQLERAPFFDLSGYIDAEVARLSADPPTVTKTIVLNDQRETRELSTLGFKQELAIFRNADINRPAWLDKYRIDRTEDQGRSIATYTALDSSLRTREMVVVHEAERVVRIEITNQATTLLSDRADRLIYIPDQEYRIESRQVTRTGETNESVISGLFK